MPFFTQCPFCKHRFQCPDRALNGSGRCPGCADYFTLVPIEDETQLPTRGPMRKRAKRRSTAPGVAETSPANIIAAQEDTKLVEDAPVLTEPPLDGVVDELGLPPKPRWIDPIGLMALLTLAAALLCASAATLCGWVVPLAIVALVFGLAGLLLAWASEMFHLLLSGIGSTLALALLLVALAWPGVLGPTFQASRFKDTRDPQAIHVVPLPSNRNSGVEKSDWPDATRATLQQGGLRVQVVSASVEPIEEDAAAPPAKNKEPSPEYLFIRLRAHLAEDARAFAHDPSRRPDHRNTHHQPRLTDQTGKMYAERKLPQLTEDAQASSAFPVAVIDRVLVFEPPPPTVEYLRLEVPASAWGRTGSFRFTLPAAMIRRTAPEPVAPGPRPGG